MAERLTSSHFPYVPVRVEIRGKVHEDVALLDTGFDGKLIIPATWVTMDIGDPDGQSEWRVADSRVVYAPSYPESTEGGRRVSVLRRQEGAPVLLG